MVQPPPVVNNDRPTVGVVIPAYQAERFVVPCVESVLGQTHDVLDVVVVDDGSTDRTTELVRKFDDPRLRLLSQDNAGVSKARNRGAAEVRGDLLAFLDADDVWAPTKLERQVSALLTHPEWACVGSFMYHVDASGRRLGVTGEPVDEQTRKRVATGDLMPFPMSSVLMWRSCFEALRGFDESLQVMVEDLDLMARLAVMYPFGVLAQPLGGYRMHGGSESAIHFRNQRDAARFVQMRMRSGPQLSWEQFLLSQGTSFSRWRSDTAAYAYRRAGVNAAEGRWPQLLAAGLAAGVLGPIYTCRRLLLQRGRLMRRGG